MAEVAVALRCTPEEVWLMDTVDLVTVIDVLSGDDGEDELERIAGMFDGPH